jgi:hypothetical protein
MQEKLAAGAESSPKVSRKHKNVDTNSEVEAGDGTAEQVVNEKTVEEPAIDAGAGGEPAGAPAQAAAPEPAAASGAQEAAEATRAKEPVQTSPHGTEARQKSMAERLRFKRRIRRRVR